MKNSLFNPESAFESLGAASTFPPAQAVYSQAESLFGFQLSPASTNPSLNESGFWDGVSVWNG